MAKKGGKKTAGIPNTFLVVGLVGVASCRRVFCLQQKKPKASDEI